MTRKELFEEIRDCSSELYHEYEQFCSFIGKEKPKDKNESRIDLIWYILRRNIVLARDAKNRKKGVRK